MSTNRYVVAPREPVPAMVHAAVEAMEQGRTISRIYTAMLAAIPDDPDAPVLVERDELERLRKDAERYRCLSRALDDGFWQVGEVEILDSWGRSQLNLIADSCEMNSRIDAALRHVGAIRPDEKEGV